MNKCGMLKETVRSEAVVFCLDLPLSHLCWGADSAIVPQQTLD